MSALFFIIRNYYEREGSFDGIENQSFFSQIKDFKEKNNYDSIDDVLYTALGFTNEKMKPKELCDHYFNIIATQDDIEAKQEYKKLQAIDFDMVKTTSSSLKKPSVALPENLIVYGSMLSDFYYHDRQRFLVLDGKLNLLADHLTLMNLTGMKGKLNLTVFEKALVKIIGDAKMTYVSGNTFFVNTSLTNKEKELIQLYALSKLAGKLSAIPSALNLTFSQLLNLHDVAPAKYRYLLALCHANNITYKELLQTVNFNVPDCAPLYNRTGYAAILVQNTVFYYTNSNDTVGLCNCQIDTFMSMLNTEYKENSEMEVF